MLKNILIVVVLVVASEGFSQKILLKEFDAHGVEHLVVNADQVYSVKITTNDTNKIIISTKVEGEFSENIVVNTSQKESTLEVETGYTPYFKKANDKLAAHKVIAIDMEITVPKDMKLSISSKIATVTTHGTFKFIIIALANGSCFLNKFSGNALLQTKQGSITVYAKRNVAGEAISKYGTVENNLPKKAKYTISAESIDGAIRLLQTK